ncbi:MAG: T9SS type A sorting domain-containing protein [Tannerella sp.]|nr:T9SS type A sorting domain-containing protein [Tannerella sp.]
MKYQSILIAAALVLLAGTGAATAQNIYPNGCYSGSLTDYRTSWIANDGGIPRTHVPHSMDALFVRGDGTVATICNWDEGGTNVGVWKDGAIVSIPMESGTGSWGRNSGKAVAMDDQYVYQLMRFNGNSGNDELNSNGLRRFPPRGNGIEWQLITRYNAATGMNAPFPEGYGPLNNMLFVCQQEARYLQGLAVTDTTLIVAVPGIPALSIPDSLKIFNKKTMSSTPIGGFRLLADDGGVGYLAADKRGYVWMLQPDRKRIVAISLRNGGIRFTLDLPADANAKSFSIDTRASGQERILVANSGQDLNILIYTDIYSNTAPTLSGTFGVTGGILVKSPKPAEEGGGEYLQGEAGHLRFPGPTGVGVDDAGNIYVSSMFVNSPSAILYSYNEATGRMNWKREGLVFTSTGDFDQTQPNRVFCIEKVYDLDYAKTGGRLDRFVATTVDPFAYPQDFRLEPNPPSPIKTGVFKRKIEGNDYLFVTNMYSSILGGYRFDPATRGYIGIPCMEIRIDGGSIFWVDADGDGRQSADERRNFPQASTFSLYPDHDGNIWMADRSTQPGYSSFRVWRRTGIDANGVLQYAAPVSYRLPAHVTDVNRVLYDRERDEMLVACYTQTHPTPNTALWGQVGTTILTFKSMTVQFERLESDPSAGLTYDQELVIPASPKTAVGTTADPGVEISCKAMTYAGDYIFCFLTANGRINVYDRGANNAYAGQLTPGLGANDAGTTGWNNGWTDFTYAVNARRNDDGTYEVLAEENAFAKVVHYKLNSMKGSVLAQGDLAPEWIRLCDAASRSIDAVNIPEGQPVKFTVRVRNIEFGDVTAAFPRIDTTRCQVYCKVTDRATGLTVHEGVSARHGQNISGSDFVDMTMEGAWRYTKGSYRVEVDVNYGNSGKECKSDNNLMSFDFGGGDNTGEISGPVSSIDGLRAEDVLTVSPNPASTFIYIDVNAPGAAWTLTLIAPDGREVLQQPVAGSTSVDVSAFPRGYYLLQVAGSEGTFVRKIILR